MSVSYNWNNKIRGHRRDTPPNVVPDIASLVQTNPASSTQAKYTGIKGTTGVRVVFSVMNGETDYLLSAGHAGERRSAVVDTLGDTADFNAAHAQEQQPNSRFQFDNIFRTRKTGSAAITCSRAACSSRRLYFDDSTTVLDDMCLNYSNGMPTQVRECNTPADAEEHRQGARLLRPGRLVDRPA